MTLVNTEYKLISATQADEDAYIGTVNVIRQQVAQPWTKLTAADVEALNGTSSYQGKFVWSGSTLNQLAGREVLDPGSAYAGSLDPAQLQKITPGHNDSGGGFAGGFFDALTEMVPGLAFVLTTTAFGSAVSSSLAAGTSATTAAATSEGIATGTVTTPAAEAGTGVATGTAATTAPQASYGLGEALGGMASPEAVAGGAAPASAASSSGILSTVKTGLDIASKAATVARLVASYTNPKTGEAIKLAAGETPPVGFFPTPYAPIANADMPTLPADSVTGSDSVVMVGVLALLLVGGVLYFKQRK